MNYQEALTFLHELCKFGINLGLNRINKLLENLENPHKKLKTIHIAGTNGKGSTTAILVSILKSAGYKVGVYTSPHLSCYTERIKINDLNISKEDFAMYMKIIKEVIPQVLTETGESPTEFEILTALAFKYFYDKKVDIAVVEVGMGGRLDSTNVLVPEISIITNISMDHTKYLGSSLESIAREKAGIIKSEVPVVISLQESIVKDVLVQKAKKLKSPIFNIDQYKFCQLSFNEKGQSFFLKTERNIYEKLFLSLLGDHQIENAVTAIISIEVLQQKGWKIKKQNIEEGLTKAKWPGRLEIICKSPKVLIDGAHNPKGAIALAKSLKKYFNYNRLIIVLGVLEDKDKENIIKPLASLGDIFIVTKPLSPRSGDWKSVGLLLSKYNKKIHLEEDFKKAIYLAFQIAKNQDLICISGSLYLIGEARDYVLNTYPEA